jgi:hypothetical protein
MFHLPVKFFTLPLLLIMVLALTACEPVNDSLTAQSPVIPENQTQVVGTAKAAQNELPASKILPIEDFMSAEWIDLIPADDLQALINPPEYLDDIVDGSPADDLNNTSLNNDAFSAPEDDRYQQALVSTRVVPELNNVAIRIPAFIVPLEFDDEQKVTQFFLVPFFGACIHQPPPPPNQTVFAHYARGFTLESIYDPLWVSGIMKTSTIENDMATAAYSMEVHHLEMYLEE